MSVASEVGRIFGKARKARMHFLHWVEDVRTSMSISFVMVRLGRQSTVPVSEVHGFNSRTRDKWVEDRAKSVVAGSHVLDVGAGTAPYRDLFHHCRYETQDFSQYEGYQGREGQYAEINYVSDIANIPVPDSSFDVILCTEVLEHVPRPIEALRELVRVTKPGGRLFLTAPLGSGLHQEPYHYYGGYTDHWYRKFLTEFGCEVISIEPNHGFFANLAQECSRFYSTFDQHKEFHGSNGQALSHLMGEVLPRYLFELDSKVLMKEFTVGFHVEARRLRIPIGSVSIASDSVNSSRS